MVEKREEITRKRKGLTFSYFPAGKRWGYTIILTQRPQFRWHCFKVNLLIEENNTVFFLALQILVVPVTRRLWCKGSMAREGRALSLPGGRLKSEILHKCAHFNSHFTHRQERKCEFINAFPRYCGETLQYTALDTDLHVSLGAEQAATMDGTRG